MAVHHASLVLTAAGLISLAVKGGPKYGIDFSGGALMYLRFNHGTSGGQDPRRAARQDPRRDSVQQLTGKPEVLVGTEITDERN